MAERCDDCPLERFLKLPELKYTDLIEIEEIVSSDSSNCPHDHPPLAELLLHYRGESPLFLACKKGDKEVVRRIVEVWEADVNSPIHHGCAYIPGNYIYGASPLFVAALFNHSEIVRYLIENKAADLSEVNHHSLKMNDGLTPLHAAFFSDKPGLLKSSEQNDTIRCLVEYGANPSSLSSKGIPIWMTGSLEFYHSNKKSKVLREPGCCSPGATTLLIELGMSVTQQDPVGRTILHHLAGPALMNDTEVIKLLVEKGADLNARDSEGMTIIMAAAIGNNELPNLPIFKYLLESGDIPNMDKINALEVAAAVILSYEEEAHLPSADTHLSREDEYVNHAQDIIIFLDRARNLRRQENCLLMPNAPVNGRAVEFITSAENLHHIEQHRLPEYGIQSVLIRFRIFSSISWKVVYRYLWPFVKYFYSERLKKNRQFALLLDISWNVLESIRLFELQQKGIYLATFHAVKQIVETLQELHRCKNPLFNIETIKTSLDLMVATYQTEIPDDADKGWRSEYSDYSSEYFDYLYTLISMLNRLPEMMSNQEIMHAVRLIISQNGTDTVFKRGLMFRPIDTEPPATLFAMVDLLLRNEADPHAVDRSGNGLLHYLALEYPCEQREATGRLLLDHGVHLDRANKEGKTAADFWLGEKEFMTGNFCIDQMVLERNVEGINKIDGELALPDWLKEDIPMLKCLAARMVRRENIPYDSVETFPVTLIEFTNMHGKH